jgi:excisionase family DNA binding protein
MTNGDPFDGLPELIEVPEAARLLGISRSSAYEHCKTGVLPSKRLGGRVYVIRRQLREFLEAA